MVKRGQILAWASNAVGTRSRGSGYSERTIHAERNAVKALGDIRLLRGADMYVFRIPRLHSLSPSSANFLYSKPCEECTVFLEKCMREYGLRRVYYTMDADLPVAPESREKRAELESGKRARMPRNDLRKLLFRERLEARERAMRYVRASADSEESDACGCSTATSGDAHGSEDSCSDDGELSVTPPQTLPWYAHAEELARRRIVKPVLYAPRAATPPRETAAAVAPVAASAAAPARDNRKGKCTPKRR